MQLFQAFAGLGENFLRFLGEAATTEDGSSGFQLYFQNGEQGYYHTVENRDTVLEMMVEFSGTQEIEPVPELSFAMSPVQQLVLLGACDVILSGRYEGGWFTPASIRNTWALSEEGGYNGLCAPVAQITEDGLASLIAKEDVALVLETLADEEVLESDEAEGYKVYALAPEYQYLPALFSGPDFRFALYQKDTGGKDTLLYVITKERVSWAFIMNDGDGSVRRLSGSGFLTLLDSLFPQDAYCTNCGAALSSGVRFCSACGTKTE